MRGKLMRVLVVLAMSVGSPVLAQGVHGASEIQDSSSVQGWTQRTHVESARQRAERERQARIEREKKERLERERLARLERERQARIERERQERARQERERLARLERERQAREHWNRENPMRGHSARGSQRG
ncbi:ATP-dependent DNA helicase [Pyxidicoccus sp. 3LG]